MGYLNLFFPPHRGALSMRETREIITIRSVYRNFSFQYWRQCHVGSEGICFASVLRNILFIVLYWLVLLMQTLFNDISLTTCRPYQCKKLVNLPQYTVSTVISHFSIGVNVM